MSAENLYYCVTNKKIFNFNAEMQLLLNVTSLFGLGGKMRPLVNTMLKKAIKHYTKQHRVTQM